MPQYVYTVTAKTFPSPVRPPRNPHKGLLPYQSSGRGQSPHIFHQVQGGAGGNANRIAMQGLSMLSAKDSNNFGTGERPVNMINNQTNHEMNHVGTGQSLVNMINNNKTEMNNANDRLQQTSDAVPVNNVNQTAIMPTSPLSPPSVGQREMVFPPTTPVASPSSVLRVDELSSSGSTEVYGAMKESTVMVAAMQVMPQMKTVMKQDWSANMICIVKMSDFAGDLGVTDLLSKEQLEEQIVFKMCKGTDENGNDVYEVKASIAHILKALGKYGQLKHSHFAIMKAWDHVKKKTSLAQLSDGADVERALTGTKSGEVIAVPNPTNGIVRLTFRILFCTTLIFVPEPSSRLRYQFSCGTKFCTGII